MRIPLLVFVRVITLLPVIDKMHTDSGNYSGQSSVQCFLTSLLFEKSLCSGLTSPSCTCNNFTKTLEFLFG